MAAVGTKEVVKEVAKEAPKEGADSAKIDVEGQVWQQRWKIDTKLGEGGFGAVYKTIDMKTNEKYAIKLEQIKEEDSMLKMEIFVLKAFKATKTPQPHICQLVDYGDVPPYRYLVMQLVGRNLADLRRACPDGKFTDSTNIRIGLQSLEGIESLHRIGFIHRDIKPANFAMGNNENDKRNVYLLDFGLCRQYIGRDGQIRRARKAVGFRGTIRYASINTHLRKELGRHDDLWSLYYMMIECHKGNLPWRRLPDKDAVLTKKQETTVDQLAEGMEPEFRGIYDFMNRLQYTDTPNYTWLYLQFKGIITRNRYTNDTPFDWEPGASTYEAVVNNLDQKTLESTKKKKGDKGKAIKECCEEKS